jgi:hypothetical protein
MKLPLSILALACVLALLSIFNLTSCKSDFTIPPDIHVGGAYSVKSNVFNKGAYKPKSPVIIQSLYINGGEGGVPYATIKASIDWGSMAFEKTSGVDAKTIDANIKTANSLFKNYGIKRGDTTSISWAIPQDDLKQ